MATAEPQVEYDPFRDLTAKDRKELMGRHSTPEPACGAEGATSTTRLASRSRKVF